MASAESKIEDLHQTSLSFSCFSFSFSCVWWRSYARSRARHQPFFKNGHKKRMMPGSAKEERKRKDASKHFLQIFDLLLAFSFHFSSLLSAGIIGSVRSVFFSFHIFGITRSLRTDLRSWFQRKWKKTYERTDPVEHNLHLLLSSSTDAWSSADD